MYLLQCSPQIVYSNAVVHKLMMNQRLLPYFSHMLNQVDKNTAFNYLLLLLYEGLENAAKIVQVYTLYSIFFNGHSITFSCLTSTKTNIFSLLLYRVNFGKIDHTKCVLAPYFIILEWRPQSSSERYTDRTFKLGGAAQDSINIMTGARSNVPR